MIGHHLLTRAAQSPSAPAVVYGARRYTYAELNDRACRLANGLGALGIGHGDRFAVLLHNCNQFVEAMFAAAKLGAIFVPLNFRLVAREIAAQLEACTPKALLVGTEFAAIIGALEDHPQLPRHRILVDATADAPTDEAYETWLASQPSGEPDTQVTPEDVAMLMHSSGTTGRPKGIVFTHSTVQASCAAKIADFALTECDVTVVFGPLFHAGPLMDLALPLLVRGGRVVVGHSRHFDPAQLLRTIACERGTVVPIYPTMLRRLLREALFDVDLSSLRLIVTGGEAAPLPVIRGIHERFPHVAFVNNYGSTEGGPITTFLAPRESLRKIGSVGKEASSVEVRIADERGRALGANEVGEILVRSPFVCRGYWNQPQTKVGDGWWRTGDLARRDEEGFIWIEGRAKDLIKSGAEAIYPIEVEQAIAELDAVEEVSVIGVPDDEWGESVVAFVVKRPAADIDAARVIAHCRERLASYKKPRYVIFVENLPRGTTSKVSKQALRAMWSARAVSE